MCHFSLSLSLPPGGTPRLNSYFGKPNLTLVASSVVCAGSEQTINDCSAIWLSLDQGKTAVAHVEVAGVTCTPNTPPPGCQLPPDYSSASAVCNNGAVHLDAPTPGPAGLLHYCFNGQWTSLCTLDSNTAAVACRQLGYTSYSCKLRKVLPFSLSSLLYMCNRYPLLSLSGASLITNGAYGNGMGYSLVDGIMCPTGAESSFSSCRIDTPSSQCLTKCTTSVAIRCYGEPCISLHSHNIITQTHTH